MTNLKIYVAKERTKRAHGESRESSEVLGAGKIIILKEEGGRPEMCFGGSSEILGR